MEAWGSFFYSVGPTVVLSLDLMPMSALQLTIGELRLQHSWPPCCAWIGLLLSSRRFPSPEATVAPPSSSIAEQTGRHGLHVPTKLKLARRSQATLAKQVHQNQRKPPLYCPPLPLPILSHTQIRVFIQARSRRSVLNSPPCPPLPCSLCPVSLSNRSSVICCTLLTHLPALSLTRHPVVAVRL